MKNLKVIRSLRLANELVARGHKILSVEPCRKSPGYSVFVFEETDDLRRLLAENARK